MVVLVTEDKNKKASYFLNKASISPKKITKIRSKRGKIRRKKEQKHKKKTKRASKQSIVQ
jgi:hypothetical protein